MRSFIHNTLRLLQFDNLTGFSSLFHAVTTRGGGVSPAPFSSLNLGGATGDRASNIAENYRRLSRALDVDLSCVVSSHQVHGTEIACIEQPPSRGHAFPDGHVLEGYDGFITAVPGIPLLVRVADCVPVILYEPEQETVAIVHAGWRGTAGSIAARAADLMEKRFGCDKKKLRAGIGPSIGPCCYEVGREVASCFQDADTSSRFIVSGDTADAWHLDLQEANRMQLIGSGLLPEHVEVSWLCTACNLNLFFSHRGEQGKTGRFVLVAGLRV